MDMIRVVEAVYLKELVLQVLFSDGQCRTIDFRSFFERHPHPQYNKYQKVSEFRKFTLRNGNIIWGKHADLCFPINALYHADPERCCEED